MIWKVHILRIYYRIRPMYAIVHMKCPEDLSVARDKSGYVLRTITVLSRGVSVNCPQFFGAPVRVCVSRFVPDPVTTHRAVGEVCALCNMQHFGVVTLEFAHFFVCWRCNRSLPLPIEV
jgi:hypothetical protein